MYWSILTVCVQQSTTSSSNWAIWFVCSLQIVAMRNTRNTRSLQLFCGRFFFLHWFQSLSSLTPTLQKAQKRCSNRKLKCSLECVCVCILWWWKLDLLVALATATFLTSSTLGTIIRLSENIFRFDSMTFFVRMCAVAVPNFLNRFGLDHCVCVWVFVVPEK